MSKKEKKIGLLIVVLIILSLVIQQFVISRQQDTTITNEELKACIDILNHKIDSINDIRDSLIIVVDSTKVKIITLEKKHETIRDSIISQSVSYDCFTFAEYLSKYNSRLSGNNNSDSTQDSKLDI